MVVPTAAVGGIVQALAPGLIGATGTVLLAPGDPSPGIKPGDLLRAALQVQSLSESGRVPRVSTDPFTGNLVISTESQSGSLFNLLGERFAREALASTPEESAEVFAAREEFIGSRREVAGFPAGPPAVTEAREQVVLSLSRESPKEIAPGVVSSARPGIMSRRLGGPCAGPITGFARLNCARGGIS